MKTDINPFSNYKTAYKLYLIIISACLPNNITNHISNKYRFYTLRTTQKLDTINEKIPIIIKPSILCIQCDNRKGIEFVENSKKINLFACKHFGFKYNFSDKLINGNPYINKIIYLREQMNKNCEYIMWLDSDAFILPSFNIYCIINNFSDKSLFAASDGDAVLELRGGRGEIIYSMLQKFHPIFCAGIFIIKNNSKGKEIVDFMIEHLTNPEKIRMYEKIDPTRIWAGFTYEQGIMNVAIRKYRKHCALINSKYLNDSPNNMNEKSWIIHAMGESTSERNIISLKVAKLWDYKM